MQWTFIFCVLVSSIIIMSSVSVGSKQKRSLSFFKNLFFGDMVRPQENCTKNSQRKPSNDVVDKNTVPKTEQDEMKRKQTRPYVPESEENNENNLLTNYTNDQSQTLSMKNTVAITTNENSNKVRLTKIENLSDDEVLINTEPIITSTTEDLNIDTIDYDTPKTNIMPSEVQFMNSKIARSRKYSYEQEKEKTIQIFTLNNNSDVTVTEINKQLISPTYVDARAKDIILNEPSHVHQIYPNVTNPQHVHNMIFNQKHPPMVYKKQPPLVILKQQHPLLELIQQHPLVVFNQQHPLVVLKHQHPQVILKQQHPQMVLKQQHPLLELKQQHPLLELKHQYPQVVLKQQHPLLELKQHHPQVMLKHQHPQVILKQQHPQVVLKQQHPDIVFNQEHPHFLVKQQHSHMVLNQQHPDLVLKQYHPRTIFDEQHSRLVLKQQHSHMAFNQQHPHIIFNKHHPDLVLKQQHPHKFNQQYEKLGIKMLPNSAISMYTGKPILVLDNTTETTKTSVSYQDVIINKTLHQSTEENLRGDIPD